MFFMCTLMTSSSACMISQGFYGCEVGRPEPEARDKPQTSKQLCVHRALQDGGHPCLERPAKSRRLDGKGGSQGRIFHASDMRRGPSIPKIFVQRPNLPVQMSALRPRMRFLCLHQDPEACRCPGETTGCVTDRLHRRHSHPGRVQGTGSGSWFTYSRTLALR